MRRRVIKYKYTLCYVALIVTVMFALQVHHYYFEK